MVGAATPTRLPESPEALALSPWERSLLTGEVYLRNLPAVKHRIPDPSFEPADLPPDALEGIFGLKDYGIN